MNNIKFILLVATALAMIIILFDGFADTNRDVLFYVSTIVVFFSCVFYILKFLLQKWRDLND